MYVYVYTYCNLLMSRAVNVCSREGYFERHAETAGLRKMLTYIYQLPYIYIYTHLYAYIYMREVRGKARRDGRAAQNGSRCISYVVLMTIISVCVCMHEYVHII